MVRALLTISLAVLGLTGIQAQSRSTLSFVNDDGSQLLARMQLNLSALLTEFNTAFVQKRQLQWDGIDATTSARERINSLWANGMFRCFDTEMNESLLKVPGGMFQVRNIPLIITSSEGEPKTEEGVLSLTAAGHLDDLYFGIEQHRYKDVMAKGSDLKDFRRRQMILDFLENFRTAYNRKDLDMLQKTFSENALIIVGKVIEEKTDGPNLMSSLGAKRVEMVRYNKQQYMGNLQTVFSRNQFIDVSFDGIEVMRHGTKDYLYGVNLRQVWRSSNYSDDGYLFLLIDFEDESHPLVHVRAWQPHKDTRKDEVIELGDFDVVK